MRSTVIAGNTAVLALLLAFLLPIATPLAAQEAELVAPAELDAAVADHESSDEAARAELGSFLADPAVRKVADEHGLDLDHLERSVQALDADQVERLAEASEAMRQSRTTITISASTIVLILLLILILS